jgi:hypothetical protein
MTDTAEAANKDLVLGTDGYPEMDDQEELDKFEEVGVYNYARINIQDNVGRPEFKNTYLNLIVDIKAQPFKLRRIFCQKMLDKIFEVYDFQFSESFDITSDVAIDKVLEFIEFIEYDNILFLSLVWEMLKADIMKVDIETMSNSRQNIIIKEVEEQLETHDQGELISLFLRTYYKEKFIEWFIRESKRSKALIKLEILEREGKLNA